MPKRQNTKAQREAQRTAAMPEVKRLVKRFGRATIANCLGKLKDHEKSVQRLNAMKREVAALEKRLA